VAMKPGKIPRRIIERPYNSKIIPTAGHPKSTMHIPRARQRVAVIRFLSKKKPNDFRSPTESISPAIRNIFPRAINPPSKNSIILRNRNEIAKPSRPRPIF